MWANMSIYLGVRFFWKMFMLYKLAQTPIDGNLDGVIF